MAAPDSSPAPDPSPGPSLPSSNPDSNPNPNPNLPLNPNPSTPVQTPIAPPPFAPQFMQYGAVQNPNPSYGGLQPPGVGSPMGRPVGMYQAVPGQHPMQYGQNGFMAPAGAIPPPGMARFPGQFGLIRPGFAPRPIPQIMRPNMAGIRPGPTPPIMSPLLRPINPVPLVEKPQTTVYVGKIAPTVDNDFLLSLLRLCGPVKSWKRAQDPSDGKPKGFGFCEFEAAEGVLRALRLLSKLNLDGQELVLNINQATREYLEKYVERKTEREKYKETESLPENSDPTQSQTEAPKSTAEESKKESEDSSSNKKEEEKQEEAQKFGIVNDEDRKADKEAVEKIESMLDERAKSLPPPPPLPPPNAESANLGRNQSEVLSRVKEGDSDPDLIRSGEKNSEDNVSESKNEVEASSGRSRRERSRERERERNNRDKDREREKEREADRYERDRERDRMKREREREDRVRQSDRLLKDRLKDWESRERERDHQRHHERDREKERERERKREVVKQEEESEDEGNNERDRKRRRRGGNSSNSHNNSEERKRKRQREKEEDVSDRLKEEEEMEEEIRREKELEKERLLRERELEKEKEVEKEKEEQLKREMYVKDVFNEMYRTKEGRESVDPMQVDLEQDNNNDTSNTNSNSNSNNNNSNGEGETTELGQENVDSKLNNTNNNNGAPKKLGFGLFGSGKRTSVPSVFQQEEDLEQENKKMRPLIPIDYSAEELQAVSQTDSNEEAAQEFNKRISGGKEKREREKKGETKKVLDAKQLIDMIPKTKEELFSYEINWTVYDKHGLNERMRPWISKKITEFLGEEEETLVDYIVSCTRDHVEASKLLELLQAILDEEAEMFVLKMWRMLIFEIKKVETGIPKGK